MKRGSNVVAPSKARIDPATYGSWPLSQSYVVVFRVRDAALQVLLVRRPNDLFEPFSVLGLSPAALLTLTSMPTLKRARCESFTKKPACKRPKSTTGSWGNASRDPRGWSATHVYFSLIPPDAADRNWDELADTHWSTLQLETTGEQLAFDHAMLIRHALTRLRNKVEYTSLPAFLMPHEFTLTDLQTMYETILARRLEKKAFRTRFFCQHFGASAKKD